MTARTVEDLTDDIAVGIRSCDFRLVAVADELHGGKRLRSGIAIGELTSEGSVHARLRVVASPHAANSVAAPVQFRLNVAGRCEGRAGNSRTHCNVVHPGRSGCCGLTGCSGYSAAPPDRSRCCDFQHRNSNMPLHSSPARVARYTAEVTGWGVADRGC